MHGHSVGWRIIAHSARTTNNHAIIRRTKDTLGRKVFVLSPARYKGLFGRLLERSVVAKIPASEPSFTLAVTQSSGAFNGTFTPNWSPLATAKPAFKGILLHKGANQAGYGFFLSNAVGDKDPQSGAVRLSKP